VVCIPTARPPQRASELNSGHVSTLFGALVWGWNTIPFFLPHGQCENIVWDTYRRLPCGLRSVPKRRREPPQILRTCTLRSTLNSLLAESLAYCLTVSAANKNRIIKSSKLFNQGPIHLRITNNLANF
jgi:hypothetical protein